MPPAAANPAPQKKPALQPVKGTRDFYPAEMRLRNWLFEIWRQTARQFGFEEYDACVLESEELYVRKAGDEITGQIYNFQDKGGRRIALRPEMTPSLARLILQRRRSLNFPLKWFSIPQCFRYERMTRGRKREHYQWNLDVVGQPDLMADAEVIAALLGAMEKMGLQPSHVELRLNDRRILNGLLHHLGVPSQDHDPVMVVIDKREKIPPEALAQLLAELGLTKAQLRKLNAFFDAAAEGLQAVRRRLGKSSDATAELEKLVALLEKIGLGEFVTVDCTVVRGLSYYTGPVFEVRDRGAKFRSLCGGGRYDGLLSALGGESIPAVGFGFGDVVILELLADLNLLPTLGKDIDFTIVPFSEREAPVALEVGQRLRRMGYRAETDFSYRKLKRALQRAEEMGARSAVLLMPEELSRGELVVRNMKLRTENRIKVDDFIANPTGGDEKREQARPRG